jgi:adenine-specific DNA-methyltransferase
MSRTKNPDKKPIEQYEHKGKERINNPPVGLVTTETDKETGQKKYTFDPHLDPQLQWAGKTEHISFDVPTVSLHVHERIDPRTIIEAVRKHNGKEYIQLSLFESPEENPPLRNAIEFYKHKHNWSNRLIAGDSLLVMNSLLEKEGMFGKVQMIYIDPPYGIKYGSNFQPFVNKLDVKDGKDDDLTQEPEMIKAFRDTWELGIHSYLTYLRNRLMLARELLHESGSVFLQISDKNLHLVRHLMDEVFTSSNQIVTISFRKTSGKRSNFLPSTCDYLLWYAKDITKARYRQLFLKKEYGQGGAVWYDHLVENNGEVRRLTPNERANPSLIPSGARLSSVTALLTQGSSPERRIPYNFKEKEYIPGKDQEWKTENLSLLDKAGRLYAHGNTLKYVRFMDDFPYFELSNIWDDTWAAGFTEQKNYVVQTATKVLERCILMTTDPGDLVFDPTCGSGTTAYVAEQWGRRWITCDTSRVAVALAKQRLMTALYNFYEFAHPDEGVSSGFKYKTVSHITLKSIANNEPPTRETLYDQPFIDNSKARVSGPFTVEAVPAPAVKSLSEVKVEQPADKSIARSGETLRHSEWKDELFKTGIRGKSGQRIEFSRVETLPGTRWLHIDGETKELNPQRVAISFGPEHAPLEQRQVELAIEEARKLVPKPKIIVFAAFQFDPEASKDIDETDWPGVTLLKAQMNADLLTEDLKKQRSSNESFWLIGQPDVRLEKISDGKDKGKHRIEVLGFDYYNTRTGTIESGGTEKIAIWMLDTDYDGRSLFPKQVFFIMAGKKEGWSRLARNLKAEIDEELIEAYRGTASLPFHIGENKRIAVKIVDDRGIESLKIIEVR